MVHRRASPSGVEGPPGPRRGSTACKEQGSAVSKGRLTPGLERGEVGVLAHKKKEDSSLRLGIMQLCTGMTDREGELAVTRESGDPRDGGVFRIQRGQRACWWRICRSGRSGSAQTRRGGWLRGAG